MVAQLPAFLLARDYRWIVFTATSTVRGILQGFGAPLVELARADAARVATSPDRWGRYYRKGPARARRIPPRDPAHPGLQPRRA